MSSNRSYVLDLDALERDWEFDGTTVRALIDRIREAEAEIQAAHSALDKKPVPRTMTLGSPASLDYRIGEYTLGWPLQHATRGERDRFRYALERIVTQARHRIEEVDAVLVAEIAGIASAALKGNKK